MTGARGTLEIGSTLPTSTSDPARPILGDVPAAARFAEEAGLDSVWASDHLLATAPILDSTATLAAAAAVTERIGIGYAVLLPALRPVAWAAKQIATLQHLSGDRLRVGVGTGNPAHGDIAWRAAGFSFADRGRRTDEALEVLPDLIAGRTATLPDGTVAALAPSATVPPILIAGNGTRALRRAARYGDGWISLGNDDIALTTAIERLAELAAEYGRPAPGLTVLLPQEPAVGALAERLAALADRSAERVIVYPPDGNWRAAYEFIAAAKAAAGR
ncbi:LLM class flavin-dependent oxidoreductase [Nocardia sp. alder85J]|uniref:LLM class flavin-dependent oxidoreductase n=1 Tax=Nocardia sp. alder85J TaxID=2862949 RepID=UPI001CD348B9|nr:LLM class flavin-dependent oxidoreductase [Nocardia sp. alder85J]MCX4098947.1 LLM class flavin-dependent oxidoreductase [Nocardia sp. alder85J]